MYEPYTGIHVDRFTSTLTMSSWWGATAQTTARTRKGEITHQTFLFLSNCLASLDLDPDTDSDTPN
jgi:hypothetical protein